MRGLIAKLARQYADWLERREIAAEAKERLDTYWRYMRYQQKANREIGTTPYFSANARAIADALKADGTPV